MVMFLVLPVAEPPPRSISLLYPGLFNIY